MILFTEFLDQLGVALEAGQRVYARMLYDGVDPVDLEPDERALAARIFGPVERVPPLARSVVSTVAGGRSGKTYLAALRLLHLALTADLSKLAPGERAFAAIVAPDLDLARQALGYAAGAARQHPQIRAAIAGDTTDALTLRSGKSLVALRPFAASRGGVTGRGKSLVGLLLDETCFFRDAASGVVNDEAIYKAASPRVIEGGQTIVTSTPWAASGLLHALWRDNWGRPRTTLVAHAPTEAMREAPHILAIVARERERDPDNARIEFDAEWGSAGASAFFSADELDGAFDAGLSLGRPARPGERTAAGGDLGFARNSSSLAIVHDLGDQVVLAELLERRATATARLSPSAVCAEFAAVARGHGCPAITADGHYRETLREHLLAADLALRPAPSPPSEAWVALRAAAREGRLRVPEHPLLRAQLAAVRSRLAPSGQIAITQPTTPDGRHGDLAAALALAVWSLGAWGADGPEAPAPAPNPEAAILEAEQRAWRARQAGSWATGREAWGDEPPP